MLGKAAGVQSLYDRAGEPKTLIWTETDHVGARKAEIVKDLVRLIESYLEGGGTGKKQPPGARREQAAI